MGVDNRHPDYINREPDWQMMADLYAGERTVKEKGPAYLPPTSGMVSDGVYRDGDNEGKRAYEAYLTRAHLPDFVKEAVSTLVGVMHRKPPSIKVPAAMEPWLADLSRQGESAEMLLRRINEQQLLKGRHGLLVDVDEVGDRLRLVPYLTESIINWDDDRAAEFAPNTLNFLVLQEDVYERGLEDAYSWTEVSRFRVCQLNEDTGRYETFTETESTQSDTVEPVFRGRGLDSIPFVSIGANDLLMTPDDIPLLGLGRITLLVYRGEADLRQTLFMLGQDTLVVIGADGDADESGTPRDAGPTRIGAGARLDVPLGGDAKFIGVKGDGLPEQRRVLADDYVRARELGSRLLEPRTGQAESGEALKVRVAATTATLTQLAKTSAAGLERALKLMARWAGFNEDEVFVEPNLDFAEANAPPQALLALLQAKQAGAPISLESIHEWARRNGYTTEEFQDEIERIKGERELMLASAAPVTASTPATTPEEDDAEETDPLE